jgi:trigger factor
MQVSVETTSTLERQMTITVPADHIEDDVNSRLKQTASTARLDGFRPGKIPFKVIKRRYGAGARQEVLGEVIQKSFYDAITQEKLKPAGGPTIESKNDAVGEDFVFLATFEVYPEIEFADYSSVAITKQISEITDADVDNTIDVLCKQHVSWTEADKAAEDGDQVNIDFDGFKDGEAFDGGKAVGHDLVIGSNTMIPGFETGIAGMKPDEEKEIKVIFPEDYQAENLAGQDVAFKIKVNSVSAAEMPTLNAALFEKFGVQAKTLKEFKAEIRKNMEREVNSALKNKLKIQVFDELVKLNDIAVPKALIDDEIDRLKDQAIQKFGGGQEFDKDKLPSEIFTDQAKDRVSTGLLVSELVSQNEMKADAERVQGWIKATASSYEQPQEFIDHYNNNKDQLAMVENLILEEQVMDNLLALAKVTEEAVSYEVAIQPPAPTNEESSEDEDSSKDEA